MSLSVGARLGLLTAALVCTVVAGQGQSKADVEAQRRAEDGAFWEREREMERSKRRPLEPLRPRRKGLRPPPERRLTEEHMRLLYPSPEERASYAEFLRRPRTGLARLLPLIECMDDPRVVKVGGSCLDVIPPVPGGGAFFSFASGGHQSVRAADLWLKDGAFHVGFAGGVLGVLTALGDVPIESVTPETPGVNHLSRLAPPGSPLAAQGLYRQYEDGLTTVAGHTYSTSATARAGTTYALRSVTYQGGKYDGLRKPADVLVTFRVVGRAADGSVTLIWRELRRQKGPRFSR